MATRTLFLISGLLIALTYAAVPLETQPKPVEEFVFVQKLGSGARPIARKEKLTLDERPFETAHKLPHYVTYVLNQNGADEVASVKQKREARTTAAPAPAPAGSIKLDPLKLIEKYKNDLKTSSTAAPKLSTRTSNGRRTKKEAKPEPVPTSPRPVLTSGAPPTPRTLNVGGAPLVASGSEKQRSRIQIKKGPNGQEYEYEYVYYYYDDDDDKETTEKVLNSHDGPPRNELSSSSEEKTHYSKEAASNEVIPSGRGRSRGRQLEDEDTVGEDRLPPSTRFPPRSRNLATTPTTEEETKATRGRGRGRGTTAAPTASTESDSVSEETQGSRGRTRANVRRPSLDLVDSASFNTHSGTAGAEPPNGGPSFPSDLPSGPVRFLGATPNERVDLQDGEGKAEKSEERSQPSNTEKIYEGDSTVSSGTDATTTMMSPMDKVALDLYAILQGTQKLSGEADVEDSTATTDESDVTTADIETTEVPTTEYITPSTTTTTTTTTTTAAPTTTTTTTTTTTEAPAFGRGGFRRGQGRRKHGSTTAAPASAETAPSETKPKGRFGRPNFGRPKPGGARTTAEPAHEPEVTKEEAKPAGRTRPGSKSRFGAGRNKPSTTESSADHAHEEGSTSTSKPGLSRPRPGFNLRGRARSTTVAPTESDASADDEGHSEGASSTTAKPKLRPAAGGSNIRPLRPGPRINLRGRPGATTTAAPEAPVEETSQEEIVSSEEPKEETPTSPAPVEDKNPLNKLRNRHRANAASAGTTAAPAPVVRPKAAASASVQVRRVNPLIGRRRPGVPEPSSTEAPQEPEPTVPVAEESEDTEAPAPSSSTTEEPRGLNKLLAGRRRLATRQPGSHK